MRLGSHLTDEQKARDSLALMGHVATGPKHHTAESRAKMSVSHMGNKGILGQHLSPETRAKLSVIRQGRIKSPETRARMSAADKLRVGPLNGHWNGGPQMANARSHAKRRTLGYVYLNESFIGCEGHHIDNEQIICLPKALHRSIYHNQRTGQNMDKINALAYEWLAKESE